VASQLLQRNALWNAGIFIVKASAALNSFRELQPGYPRGVRDGLAGACPDGGFIRLEETGFAKCTCSSGGHCHHGKGEAAKVVPFRGGGMILAPGPP
jgi:mannose-1-phosphate guanylyltransferase